MTNGITTMLTIGIDLGDRHSEVCVLGTDGEVKQRFGVATTREGLEKKLGNLVRARVVIEVGTHSPWVSRWLEGKGHEVIVADARAVRSIAESDHKTNRNDAEQLARLGRVDPKLLRPIRHRGEAVQRDRMLLAVRDHLVRTRGSFIVQARGLGRGTGATASEVPSRDVCEQDAARGGNRRLPGDGRDRDHGRAARRPDRRARRAARGAREPRVPGDRAAAPDHRGGPDQRRWHTCSRSKTPSASRTAARSAPFLGLTVRKRQSGARDPALGITKAGDGLPAPAAGAVRALPPRPRPRLRSASLRGCA